VVLIVPKVPAGGSNSVKGLVVHDGSLQVQKDQVRKICQELQEHGKKIV